MQSTIDAGAVTIRPAQLSDYSEIERLLIASSLPIDGVRDALADFFVATANGQIIGVVGMEYCCEYGLLRSTAVDADWRGQRIAKRLVERIIAEAEARGIHALYLLTTTADQYFPSFGFTVTSRDDVPAPIRETSEFKGACPASATVMCLSISA